MMAVIIAIVLILMELPARKNAVTVFIGQISQNTQHNKSFNFCTGKMVERIVKWTCLIDKRKRASIIMKYTEFFQVFQNHLTGYQITNVQEAAFRNYTNIYGYRPMRKVQKQRAYQLAIEHIRNLGIEGCIDFLSRFGIPQYKAVDVWNALDN